MKQYSPSARLSATLFALTGLLPAVAGANHERVVPPFHTLEVSLPADVTVRQGPLQPVRIDAEPAVTRALKIAVRNGVLTLAADGFRTRQPVRIGIVAPELHKLHAGGTSSVVVEGWRAEALTVHADGSSDVHLRQIAIGALQSCAEDSSGIALSGQAEVWQADARGSARIEAEALQHRRTQLYASNAASIAASAGIDLRARVRNGADITVAGQFVPSTGDADGGAAGAPCR